MITFIDESKVRHKRDPGRCYLRAGFRPVGRTKEADLLVLQLVPADMPSAAHPIGAQRALAI
jgi:hypothetical protein